MDKLTIKALVNKVLAEVLSEAKVTAGDNEFNVSVSVNKNPTKEGIKIQLIPKGNTVLLGDEKPDVNEKVQKAMNQKLAKFGLQRHSKGKQYPELYNPMNRLKKRTH